MFPLAADRRPLAGLIFLLSALPALAPAELQRVGPPDARILVTEHGILPDDGKDDSAALQSLLDKATGWTEVLFNKGHYDLSKTILVGKQTDLIGDRGGDTVLLFKNTNSGAMLEIRNGIQTCLSDLTLDAAMNPNVTQGIVVTQSFSVHIAGIEVCNLSSKEGFGPHAILFADKVTHSFVTDCVIENIGVESPWGAGIRVAKGSLENQILRNTIRNTGRGGILCNESPELVIIGNTVSGSHGEGLGIELWGGCPKSIVEDNTVDHWISVDKSPQTAVRRNTIADASGAVKAIGLELVDSSDCIFTDNTVNGGQQIGISVSNTGPKERIFWARNTIRNCVTWNAQLQGEAGGAVQHVFWRNTFEGALLNDPRALYPGQGYGVRFNGDCKNMLFLENTITGNGHGAVQTCGDNLGGLHFVRNTISKNKGPVLTGTLGADSCWTDNTVSENAENDEPAAISVACTYELTVSAMPDEKDSRRIHFSCRPSGTPRNLRHVLWDFGVGIPQTGQDAEFVNNRRNGNTDRVTVIAWDEQGISSVAEKEIPLTPPKVN